MQMISLVKNTQITKWAPNGHQILILFLLSFLGACGGSSSGSFNQDDAAWDALPVPVYVESLVYGDDEDEARIAMATEAIELVNSYFEEPLFEIVADPEEAITFEVVNDVSEYGGGDDAVGRAILESSGSEILSAYIFMDEDLHPRSIDSKFCTVLIHELGHALGAQHMDSGIMSPDASTSSGLSEEEMDQGFGDWIYETYGIERSNQ